MSNDEKYHWMSLGVIFLTWQFYPIHAYLTITLQTMIDTQKINTKITNKLYIRKICLSRIGKSDFTCKRYNCKKNNLVVL